MVYCVNLLLIRLRECGHMEHLRTNRCVSQVGLRLVGCHDHPVFSLGMYRLSNLVPSLRHPSSNQFPSVRGVCHHLYGGWSHTPVSASILSWLSFVIHCSVSHRSLMNMMAGPIAMSAPTVIAAAWFPPNQRTLPTCIMQVFNFFGIGLSNMLAMVFITAKEGDVAGIKENLDSLLKFHMWTAVVISACIYAYFPSSPNSSPCPDVTHSQTSRSQSVTSFSLKDTLKEFLADFSLLLRNKNGWILMIVYSLSQSLVLSWQSSTVIDFTSLHINFKLSEGFASSLGLRVGLISSVGSMLIALIMDKYEINKKLALYTLFIASGIIFIFGTLITEGFIQFESQHILEEVLVNLYVVGVTLACSCAPIATTLCVELCHPVSEGNTGSWLTLWFNLFALAYFLAFQILNVGTEWLNFVLPPCVIIPTMLLVCVRVRRKIREESSTHNLVLPV